MAFVPDGKNAEFALNGIGILAMSEGMIVKGLDPKENSQKQDYNPKCHPFTSHRSKNRE
jgi:hypothetical protein